METNLSDSNGVPSTILATLSPLDMLKTSNPGLYFFIKHWKIIIFSLMLIITSASVYGLWKYHGSMNEKLGKINNELNLERQRSQILENNLQVTRDEILNAKNKIDQFNTDLAALKKENDVLRRKIDQGINSNRVTESTTPEQAQQVLDDIQNEIHNRWDSINGSQTPSTTTTGNK